MKHNYIKITLSLLCLFILPSLVKAQYTTANVNGAIGAAEYGIHTDGINQATTAGVVTYLSWDATNLYIGVANANVGEALVFYYDGAPQIPVNGGTNANGTNVGFNYDGANFASLQFRADRVLYVKNGYREYRPADGANGWGAQTAGFGAYADNGQFNGTGITEVSISWANLGGLPASFNFFAYKVSAGGFVYNQQPTANTPTGAFGLAARWERYYTVTSTTNGSATPPFSRDSYVFNSTVSNNAFGAISVYDFTMNTAALQIARTGGGNWNIAGNLVVGAGTVFFGSVGPYGTTTVGNINVLGGSLNMDQTTQPMTVTGNVSVSGGAGTTFLLSGTAGGNLNIGGNFAQNGTFTHNARTVTFNGTGAQSISGSLGGVVGSPWNTQCFAFLTIANTGGTVTASSPIDIKNGFTTNASTTYNQSFGAFNLLQVGTTATINGIVSFASGSGLYNSGAVTVSTTGTLTIQSGAVFSNNSSASVTNNNITNITATAGNFLTGLSQTFTTGTTGTTTLTINAPTTIQGNITVNASGLLNFNGSGALAMSTAPIAVSVSGTLRSSQAITASAATWNINNGGKYQHNYTTTAGTIPTATWNAGSTCEIIGYSTNSTSTNGVGQSFSNFTWNCPVQTGNINLVGLLTTINGNFTVTTTNTGSIRMSGATAYTLNIGGNFSIAAGTIDLSNGAGNLVWNIGGNFSQTGGAFNWTGSGTRAINFNKATGVQTFSKTAGTIANNHNWNVGTGVTTNTLQLTSNVNLGTGTGTFTTLNNATVDFQTFELSGSSAFTANSGSTLISAHASGINVSGATGSVRVSGIKTFTNAGVNYTFNGTAAQNTGTSIGAATSIGTLNLSNTSGATPALTFGASATVATALNINNGINQLGTNSITVTPTTAASVTGGSSTAFIQTNSTGRLIRAIATAGLPITYNFPVGTAANYTPASYAFTANSTARNLSVGAVVGVHPNNGAQIHYINNRYWATTLSDATGNYNYSAAYTYLAGDVVGTIGNIRLNRFDGSWSELAGSSAAGTTLSSGAVTQANADLNNADWVGRVNPVGLTYTWDGSSSSDWNTAANWDLNIVPSSTDNVVISVPGTNTLNLTTAETITDFSVSGTGTFTISSTGTLTVAGNISYTSSGTPTIDCASTINISSGSAQTIPGWNYGNLNATGGARTLSSSGTIGICGAFTRGAGAYTIGTSTVNYNGTSTQTISVGTYYNLTISNNRGGALITLPTSGTAIDINNTFNPSLSNFTIARAGNTINFSSALSQTIPAFTYGNITSANFARTWAAAGVIDILEAFTPPSSAINTITNSTVQYSATTSGWSFSSFTTNVASRLYNNLIFDGVGGGWSSGAVTLGVAGNLSVTNGTLRIGTASNGTLIVDGTTTVNGGVLNLTSGAGTGTATFTGAVTVSAGSLNINNGAGAGTATMANTVTVSVTGTLAIAIAGSGTLNLTGSSFTQSGGTVSRTAGTATVNINRPTLVYSLNQSGGTMSGTITFNVIATTIATLNTDFNMGAGGSMQVPSTSFIDCKTFVLSGNLLNVAIGGRLVTANSNGLTSAPTASGSVQTTTRTYSASALFYYNGTGAQVTGDGLPATVDRLFIQNTVGVNLSQATTISTELNLAGYLFIGNNNLTMTSAAGYNIFPAGPLNSSNMVITNGTGYLIRSYASNPSGVSFTWQIGENIGTTEYSPVTISFTGAAAGSVGFRVVDGNEPNNAPAVNYLSRYWNSFTNFSSYSWTGSFTYNGTVGDINGSEPAMRLNIYDPNAPSSGWTEYASSSASSNVLTVTAAPGTGSLNNTNITGRTDIPMYYQSNGVGGAWATATNWLAADNISFTGAFVPSVAPNNVNSAGIFIRSGSPITVGSTVWANDLTIDAGGILTVGAGATFTIANGAAATDFTINGTFNVNNTTTIQAGSSTAFNANWNTTVGTLSSFGTVAAGPSSIYTHAFDGGTIPTATWANGSKLNITGIATSTAGPGGMSQAFYDVEWNCTSQTVSCQLATNPLTTVSNNLTITSTGTGTTRLWSGATGGTTAVGGNLVINGGKLHIANGGGSSTSTVNLNVTGNVTLNGGELSMTGTTTNNALNSNLNITGNLKLEGGNLNFNTNTFTLGTNATIQLAGNLLITSGQILRTNSLTSSVFRFNKSSGTQTYTASVPATAISTNIITWQVGTGLITNTPILALASDFTINTNSSFTVLNYATLNCGTNILAGTTAGSTGSFNLNNGGHLMMASTAGISTAPSAIGNIQTGPAAAQRVFNIGADYTYNSTVANQITGSGLPATVRNLTINNTGAALNNTVQLTNAGTTVVTSQLNLTAGIFEIQSANIIQMNNLTTVNATGGDFATGSAGGTVNINSAASVAFNGNSNPYNVSTSGGVNFGAQTVTIQNGGSFIINNGGFVNTNAPFYAVGSTLRYNTTSNPYNRGLEWSAAAGRGYPHHVLVDNTTKLNPAAAASVNAALVFNAGGNVTINTGGAIYMDYSGLNMTVPLNVNGDVTITGNGDLSLSQAIGGDISLKGNWINNGTALNTFFANSRTVTFNGTSAQTIGGTNTNIDPFAYLTINNAAGVSLTTYSISVNNDLNLQSGKLTLGANNLTMVTIATITGGSPSSYIVNNQLLGTNGYLLRTFGAVNTLFPVGTPAAYLPVTLNQAGTADYIRVKAATDALYVNGVNDATQMVNSQWYIGENVGGGNNLTTTFGWAGTSEAASFVRTNPVYHGSYNTSPAGYEVKPTSATAGSDPYTSTSILNFTGNIATPRIFVVGNLEGILGCLSTVVGGGNWNTATTWTQGFVPSTPASICLNGPVTITATDPLADIINLNINTGSTLTVSAGRLITMQAGGTITNSNGGTINLTDGTVQFSGTGTLLGANPITFKNVILNGGLTTTTVPNIAGTMEIKAGGFVSTSSVNYLSGSTLKYNTGGIYGRSDEWKATVGAGYPHNVEINGGTILDLGNGGAGTARVCAGDLNIISGALSMASTPMTNTLTVKGNVNLDGALVLSSVAGGDIKVEGNWTRGALSTFTHNNRAVFFTGAANQEVKVLGGGTETFPFMIIDKPNAATYVKPYATAPDATDITIGLAVNGDVLQILNNGSIDLNGRTVGIDGNSNTANPLKGIKVNGARVITNSGGIANGEFKFFSSTNPNQPAWKTSYIANTAGVGSLTFDNTVLSTLADGAIDFGFSGGSNLTTIQGVLQIRLGGSVSSAHNSCIYAPGSILRIANGIDYLVPSTDKTWASGSIASLLPGIPYNVEVLGAGTDLTVNDPRSLRGNMTITNGTLTLNPSSGNEFSIGGNWTRTGATSAFNNNAIACVVFNGSTPQTISCDQNANTETFNGLEIRNTGAALSNTVTLVGTRVIAADSLILNTGVLTTGANRIELPATSDLRAGSLNTSSFTTSWIDGNIRRFKQAASDTIKLPVGNSLRGNLATVIGSSLTGVIYYDANYHAVAGGNNSEMTATETSFPSNPYQTKYLSMNAGGFWTITPNTQPTGGSYSIRLYLNGMTGTLVDNQYGILKRPDASVSYAAFTPCGGTGCLNSLNNTGGEGRKTADGYALRKGLTTFSEFGIGQAGAVLPVVLTTFTATNQIDGNKLKWLTSAEFNTSYFSVERSADGIHFSEIGKVNAVGYSTDESNYDFLDRDPFAGLNYYRLRIVDFDGYTEYSNTVVLDLGINTGNTVVAFPNPFNDNAFVSINSDVFKPLYYSITDALGRVIVREEVQINEGDNMLQLNTKGFTGGLYLLEVFEANGKRIATIKMMKEN